VSAILPTPSADAASIPALEVDKVSHSYGARLALDGVSLGVTPGSFTVLLGLNGAGKSTLFSLITGLYATRIGHIRIFGRDIARQPGAALSRLGVVFQSRALDVDISVRQNLIYHAALHGIGGARAAARAEDVLRQAGLADRAREKVANLSGGQMRRVEIARALLHEPRLLLLDEPTAGLDVRARATIVDHVRRLSNEQRVGVLWATHLIDEVAATDEVVVLHKGRVLAQGPVATVAAAAGRPGMREAFDVLTRVEGDDAAGAA
jgi:ABC-2 type transport system ATP-binding protein